MSKHDTVAPAKGLLYQAYYIIYNLLYDVSNCNKENEIYGATSRSIFFGIEVIDDVLTYNEESNEKIIKQLKNINRDVTINSDEVKNTLSNFYSMMESVDFNEGYYYHFICPSKVTYEKTSKILEEDEIHYLKNNDLKFLEILQHKKSNHYKFAKKILTKVINENREHNIQEDMLDHFIDHVNIITEMKSMKELKTESVDLLKKIKYYDSDFARQEELLFSFMATKIMTNASLSNKDYRPLLNEEFLKNCFLEYKTKEYKNQYLRSNDINQSFKISSRNIEDKIMDVDKGIDEMIIMNYIYSVTDGLEEMKTSSNPELVNGYKNLVFEAARKFYIEELYRNSRVISNYDDIKSFMISMFDYVKTHLDDKTKDYHIAYKADDMIEKTINILFNECYLDFKKKEKV